MKVSTGEATTGQLFFVTDADTDWNEEKSVFFVAIVDGEYHDYVLDMSSVNTWAGLVTQLRLDPVWSAGRAIQIDLIVFVE